jgi:hypothetical protein
MELKSREGNLFAITIVGYQFPGRTGSDPQDWDANWLVIAGSVRSPKASWKFHDPSLTTWEALRLATWLRSVANGSQRPHPVGPDPDDGDMLVFTEPNLAFNYQARTDEAVVIRVYTSLEAAPPQFPDDDIYDHYVELTLSPADVQAAVTQWESELKAYPVRPSGW